jgi:hypothetical protein
MWFNSLTRLWRRTPARAWQAPASFRPAVEPLGERVLPSAATVIQPADVGVAAMVAQHEETLRVEGTFQVTDVHGSDLSATVEGYLYLGNKPGLHFTIDAHVKLMGNHIEGTPTMVFDDGSTLNLYYEIKQNRDTGIFEGTFQITGGTGQFEGASGSGEICYPIAQSGPLMMEGTITR